MCVCSQSHGCYSQRRITRKKRRRRRLQRRPRFSFSPFSKQALAGSNIRSLPALGAALVVKKEEKRESKYRELMMCFRHQTATFFIRRTHTQAGTRLSLSLSLSPFVVVLESDVVVYVHSVQLLLLSLIFLALLSLLRFSLSENQDLLPPQSPYIPLVGSLSTLFTLRWTRD